MTRTCWSTNTMMDRAKLASSRHSSAMPAPTRESRATTASLLTSIWISRQFFWKEKWSRKASKFIELAGATQRAQSRTLRATWSQRPRRILCQISLANLIQNWLPTRKLLQIMRNPNCQARKLPLRLLKMLWYQIAFKRMMPIRNSRREEPKRRDYQVQLIRTIQINLSKNWINRVILSV